jgi:hypothetical protein
MDVKGQIHALAILPPGEKHPLIIFRKMAGPQRGYEIFKEEINLLSLTGID